MSSKKWTLALWGMVIGTAIILAALIGWWIKKPGAAGILTQGIGIVTLIFGGYAAANVSQKGVIGKNYRTELNQTKGGKNE